MRRKKKIKSMTLSQEMLSEIEKISNLLKARNNEMSDSEIVEKCFWLGLERFKEKYGLVWKKEEEKHTESKNVEEFISEFDKLFGRPKEVWM